ncbi:MAG: sirohydrochlorin cobaltochelatase [Thermoguttaceae bacterium]|nr:sirohydrochlorin cobaltochelatase [Thermoguttaceae bacterium]
MTRLFVCFIACSIAAALVAPGCKLQKKESVSPDELAARKVVELVDSIHTHTWSPETDAACDAARDAWAALTPEQKALVHGEFASREFFEEGVDAPEPDDPLNADGIGENEILVASFGTSYNEGRVLDIGGIEKRIAREFPDWSVRRAFTSQIVVNHIRARDGEKIDNLTQALDRAAANGVKRLVVLPTLLMKGAEYDELMKAVGQYEEKFESVSVAAPLLGEVGATADETNADKEAVAKAILADPLAGGDSVAQTFGEAGVSNGALERNGVAVVLVGHGTSHAAALTYAQMQAQMTKLEYINIFIGTVEGNPQSTSIGEVPFAVLRKGYKKVLVRPFLVASGDHAHNDILADGGSWYSKFKSFQGIDAVGRSYGALGRIPEVQDVYIQHVKDAIQ